MHIDALLPVLGLPIQLSRPKPSTRKSAKEEPTFIASR
jgi:hypothetical protein